MSVLPPAMRILPMNRKKEFPHCKNMEDLQQQFFLEELPLRSDCDYLFYTGLKAEPNTIILFQSDRNIIASAVLLDAERFPCPDTYGYEGRLFFDRDSIKVFDPVPEATIIGIWPSVKGLGQVKWSLNPEGYPSFKRILKKIRTP